MGVPVDEQVAAELVRATRPQFAAQVDGLLQREDPPAVEIIMQALAGLSSERVEPDRHDQMRWSTMSLRNSMPTGPGALYGIMRPPTSVILFLIYRSPRLVSVRFATIRFRNEKSRVPGTHRTGPPGGSRPSSRLLPRTP